jgi:hypothetical protein
MSNLSQPIIYPTSQSSAARSRLRSLMNRAANAANHDESLRIAFIGDSTYTSSAGSGVGLHHRLHLRLGSLFGNIAGSPIVSMRNTETNLPLANSFAANNTYTFASPFATTHEWTNGLAVTGFFGGMPFAGEKTFGPTVRHAFRSVNAWAGTRGLLETPLFPQANVSLEIVGLKQFNSAEELKVLWKPTATRASAISATTLDSEVVPIALDAANGGVVELSGRVRTSLRTPDAGFDSQWGIESNVATTGGSGTKAPPVLAGVRILNNNPVGPMIDFLSSSGYRASWWFGFPTGSLGSNFRINAAPATVQLRHDVIVVGMGANDLYGTSPRTAAQFRNDLYDADGTNNKGLIGTLMDAYDARSIPKPLVVISVNPFYASDGSGAYATNKAQHDGWAAEAASLADELQAAGVDTIVFNLHRFTWEHGFNANLNDFTGLVSRGSWSGSSVSYLVGDYVLATDGLEYRCLTAHTSTASNGPLNDVGLWVPAHLHLAGTIAGGDRVHWSAQGDDVVSDAYTYLFSNHSVPLTTTVDEAVLSNLLRADIERSGGVLKELSDRTTEARLAKLDRDLASAADVDEAQLEILNAISGIKEVQY